MASIRATLSRFATIWGREEQDMPPDKVTRCFKSEYIDYFLQKKNERNLAFIREVPILENGKSRFNRNVTSKSKVLGF